jgi:hypothetical protein
MATIRRFEDIQAWQKARQLVPQLVTSLIGGFTTYLRRLRDRQ